MVSKGNNIDDHINNGSLVFMGIIHCPSKHRKLPNIMGFWGLASLRFESNTCTPFLCASYTQVSQHFNVSPTVASNHGNFRETSHCGDTWSMIQFVGKSEQTPMFSRLSLDPAANTFLQGLPLTIHFPHL